MIATPDFVLSRRQERIYVHLCDVWVKDRAPNDDGTPGPDIQQLLYQNVPCYYQFTPNVDDAVTGVGRGKRMTLITTDTIHLPLYFVDAGGAPQPLAIPDGARFVNRTPATLAHLNQGQYHIGQGAPNILPGSDRRPVDKQSIMAMTEEHPLQEIADFYGNLPGAEE